MSYFSKLTNNRVSLNASWIIVCKIIQAVFGLIVTMLTARCFGPSNYGLLNYASSIVSFLLPITELGLANILVHELVDNPEDEGKILGSSLLLSTISAFFCIICVFLFTFIVNHSERETILVSVLYSLMLIFQAAELIRYWYQSKYLSKTFSIISLIAYIIVSLYKAFLLITQKSIYWFAISQAFDYALIVIMALVVYFKKYNGKKLAFDSCIAKRMLSKSKYYIISSMMVVIFAQTDKIMLKLMVSDEACGFYSAATTCAAITGFVFQAIVDSMRPQIFEDKNNSECRYELNLKRLYCIIIYFSLLSSLALSIFSKWVILIVCGASYLPSINVLRIAVWYMTFSFLGVVRNIWILAENKQKYLWVINLFGALTNIIINFLLIPKYGASGAAMASVITQFTANVLIGFVIKPIRKNNYIMLQSLNPKLVLDLFK